MIRKGPDRNDHHQERKVELSFVLKLLLSFFRNLFPKLLFKVQGLEPQNCYLMFLFFRRVSENKYKYSRGEWVSAGKADELEGTPPVPHADNVNFPKGQEWMHNDVSFAKLKLTNCQENKIKNAVRGLELKINQSCCRPWWLVRIVRCTCT